jgi:predicted transcriptional regulator
MSTDTSCCLGPLEKKVLEIVWIKDCPSVRCVLLEINKSRKKSEKLAYTTVMTIMKRLVKKKILTRKKDGRSYRYEPKEPKEQFIKKAAHCTVQNLINKFGDLAIKALKEELQ